jgi:hypothetical protein
VNGLLRKKTTLKMMRPAIKRSFFQIFVIPGKAKSTPDP